MLDGLGWEQLAGPRRPWRPTLAAMAGRADHHGRAVHHGHRADLDRHRADARASTASSATASRCGARCSTSCAGRRPRATPAGASRPHEIQPVPAVPRRQRRPSSPRPSSPARGFTLAHLAGVRHVGWRMPSTLVTEVRRQLAARRAVRLRLLRRRRQGRPRVRAGRALRRRAGGRRPPGRPTCSRSCPPGAALRRHRRPRPGRRGRPASVGSAPDVARPRRPPVGRGPVPLAARPCRARADALLEAATEAHGDLAWVVSLRAGRRRGLVRARSSTTGGRRPARRRGPRGPRRRRLRRPGRHRPVRAREPARLAHAAPRCSCRCSPARSVTAPDPEEMPMSEHADRRRRPHEQPERPSREARSRTRAAGRGRVGRPAGQGHADRLDDQAAARRGAGRTARRGQPRPAARRSTRPRSRSWPRPSRPTCRTSCAGWPRRSTATAPQRTPSCGSPRPSWSAGSRACSTASRPPCSPSRWRPASSSSRCASSPGPAPRRPRRPTPRHVSAAASGSSARHRALAARAARRWRSRACGRPRRWRPRSTARRRSRAVAAGSVDGGSARATVRHESHGCSSPQDWGRLWTMGMTRRDAGGKHRGRLVHPPPRAHRVLDARRRGPARRGGGRGGRRRPAGARHHRPRQHVRGPRLLQGVPRPGHQADHRHRGLHGPRAPLRAAAAPGPGRRHRRRGRGRREALLPPHPAGRERRRLPQPDPALEPGLPRGLLLQAPARLGAARAPPRGPHRHHRLPRRPRAAVAAAGRRAGRAREGGPAPGHLRARQPLRRAAGPRPRRPARHQPAAARDRPAAAGAAARHQRQPLHPPRTTTSPTTPCCACRPARS